MSKIYLCCKSYDQFLQLHILHAPYTEENKIYRNNYIFILLMHCRLRKADCNFPRQQTIRRWIGEFDIISGFCDFIFQKLKEIISHFSFATRGNSVCFKVGWNVNKKFWVIFAKIWYNKYDIIDSLVDLWTFRKKNGQNSMYFCILFRQLKCISFMASTCSIFPTGKV